MGTYIALANYTDQGIRKIKDSPRRLSLLKKALKGMGGKLKSFYLTMGGYDLVFVFEAPRDEVAAQFILGVGALGNVRTTTLKAFSEKEFRKMIGEFPGPSV